MRSAKFTRCGSKDPFPCHSSQTPYNITFFVLFKIVGMKKLIFLAILLFFVLHLQAEDQKDVVLRMTEDELNACYANKEKTEQRFLIRRRGYISGGFMGFIDGCGRVVVEPVYDSALEFREGLARVKKDGKFGFIDKSGNVVIDFYLDFAWFFHEGLALAEIHGEKEEKFYIDKENKRHSAKNLEKSTDKIITFRKHYDNFILKKRKTKGNALVLGKGLVGGIEYYTDYSGQKFGYVVNDELVETCKNTKLLENDGKITFVKNDKTLKTLENFSIYDSPVCRDYLTNILLIRKTGEISFYEHFLQAAKNFFRIIEKEEMKTIFIYDLEGNEIAGFKSDYIIRKIDYLDENTIKVSFYDGREPEFFDLTGKQRNIKDVEEKPEWLPENECDFICEADKKGKKLSLEERTKYICPNTGFKYIDKKIDGKSIREIYETKTGKTIITLGAYATLKNYRSLGGVCFSVIETQENTYYLKDDKVFWSERR